MPQSLVKILVHIVWSTKDRVRLIPAEVERRLYAYIGGIITNNGGRMLIAGGDADHVHILVSIGKCDIAKLIGTLKRETSKWMKENGVRKFYWQRGYGAFSIGQSQVESVSNYIRDQKEHHTRQTFQEEFRVLCRRYEVEIDERFCWD
jgi:REP element-mobilizing transposase RayT